MDAKNYCYKLTLATYTNWRLPSIEELEMIADISRSSPAINKEFKNVKSDFYISASPPLSDIDTIFYMDFKNGHKYEASRRGRGYVRCVRVNKMLAEGLKEFGYQSDVTETLKDGEYYLEYP